MGFQPKSLLRIKKQIKIRKIKQLHMGEGRDRMTTRVRWDPCLLFEHIDYSHVYLAISTNLGTAPQILWHFPSILMIEINE